MGNVCLGKSQKVLEGADLSHLVGHDISSEREIYRTNSGPETINWDTLIKETQANNLRNLKEDFGRNMNQFLLNNILMSVQFYKNFEREKDDIFAGKETMSKLKVSGLHDMKMNYLIPYSPFTKVHENVFYRQESGQLDPLLTVHDVVLSYNNIEANTSEDFERLQDGSLQYANVDDPIYRICLEPAKQPGYVLARCVEDYAQLTRSSSVDGIHNSDQHSPRNNVESVTRRKVTPPLSWEKPAAAAGAGQPGRKGISFSDLVEVEEEEDEEEEDIGMDIRQKLGLSENRRQFGPSVAQQRLQGSAPSHVAPRRNLQERRPSGVLPPSYSHMAKNSQSLRESLKASRIGRISERSVTAAPPPTAGGTTLTPDPERSSGTRVLNKDGVSNGGTDGGSSSTSEDSDKYGYVSNKRVPLSSLDRTQTPRGSIIPETCFETKDVPIVDNDESDPYPVNADTESRFYMRSTGIMKYFASQFPSLCSKLGLAGLGTPENSVLLAPDIYCQEFEGQKSTIWKFTPTVECGFWPDQGFEWKIRERTMMRDKRTGVEYQWPSPEQIDAALKLGSNIVPKGFLFPRTADVNKDTDIEWEVVFTRAESYLWRSIHHPKLRVYLFAVLIFKAYFESFEGIGERHLRHIFYRLVEKSPGDWTEENLGEKVALLLRYLLLHLRKLKMPNYFLTNVNMFASIANHRLRAAQERAFRIRERPVIHLLAAIGSLAFTKGFYPPLDIRKLYRILTTDDTMAMANPALLGLLGSGPSGDEVTQSSDSYAATSSGGGGGKSTDRYQAKMRAERERLEREAAEAKEREAKKRRRPVVDINADIRPFDESRKRLLLEFFIQHFIKMAEKSNLFRNYGQALMYVMHCDNLLEMLSELGYGERENAFKWREDIDRLRNVCGTEEYFREYWNISYGHPKLQTSLSILRSRMDGLPQVPAGDQPSPILGTTPPSSASDSFTRGRGVPAAVVSVAADIHSNGINGGFDEEEEEEEEEERDNGTRMIDTNELTNGHVVLSDPTLDETDDDLMTYL